MAGARRGGIAAGIFVAALLAGWARGIARTGRWPTDDGPHVLGIALRLGADLRAGAWAEALRGLDTLLAPHPPGAYVPAALAYAAAGPGRTTHLLASAVVLWLLWDGTARLGAGGLGLLWLAALPLAWLQAEQYGVDLLAAACVVQAVSHLAASERLASRRHALAWGLWTGAAFMVKYTAPMFLWAPSLLGGLWGLRRGRRASLLLALGAFAAVALPWWAPHLGRVAAYVVHSNTDIEQFAQDTVVRTVDWHDAENLLWYPASVLDGWGWWGTVALLVAALAPGRGHAHWDARVLPWLGALGGWAVLVTQIMREDRYLLPGLSLLAALAGASALRWLAAPAAAVGAFFVGRLFLSPAPVPAARVIVHDWPSAGRGWPEVHEAYRPRSLDPERWKVRESLERLRALHGSDEGTVGVLTDPLSGAPGPAVYLYFAGLAGYRWNVASPALRPGDDSVYVVPFATDDWPDRRFRALLAVLVPGDRTVARALARPGLEPAGRIDLGGGAEARLYRVAATMPWRR